MIPSHLAAALEADHTLETGAQFAALVARYFAATGAAEGPVSGALTYEEALARFREPLPVQGRALDEILQRLERDVLGDANRLAHPMYMGHQVSAPLPAAVWTESVISALNNSMAVREMSPTATPLEAQVISWMCGLAGWGEGSGGTITSGGQEATHTAMLAARAALDPDAWERGLQGPVPLIFCGEHAHYAVARAGGELGLGTANVRAVRSRDWSMDVAALEQALDDAATEGRRVMAVVATAGHTATGAFDDLEAIGALCEARGLWMHVDGAHGASALFSETHRHRLRGVERARTMAWDPHKMMLLPLSAGALIARDERDLSAAFAQKAPYLFHAAAGTRTPDQGTRSFQCSRRADVMKVWVALQRYGASGIGALYDHLASLASALHAMIAARRDFSALHVPQGNILCFRWQPAGITDATELDALNLALRERYNASGRGWITTTVLGGVRVLRVTMMNPRTTESDVAVLLDGLVAEGAPLLAKRG